MGKQALISHTKGKKCVDKVKLLAKVKQEQQPLKSFFVSKSRSDAAHVESAGGVTHESLTVPDPPATDPHTASTSTGGATMTKYVAKMMTSSLQRKHQASNSPPAKLALFCQTTSL